MPPAGQDRFYKGWRPRLAHLVRGKGGVAGEVADLREDVEGALREVADESSSSADTTSSVVSDLQGEISQLADDANAALATEVGDLNALIDGNAVEALAESQALVASEALERDAADAQVTDDAAAALATEVGALSTLIDANAGEALAESQALVASEALERDAADAQVSDDAGAALATEVGALNTLIDANAVEALTEAQALVSSESLERDAAVAQATDDAAAALSTEVGSLAALIALGDLVTRSEAESLTAAAVADLDSAIAQAALVAAASLTAEVVDLNERIGKRYEVVTTDSTAGVVLATLTPSPIRAVRVIAKVVAHRLDRLEAAIYNVLALARALPSSDILTLSVGVPTATETVQVGGVTYTWFADPTGVPNAVDIGATIEISIDNLVAAINASGTDDVEYGAGTVRNPLVSASKASAATLEAVALTPGAAGDAITAVAAGMANGAWTLGGGVLGGGSDMSIFGNVVTAEHEDDAAWVLAISASGADVELAVTGVDDTAIKWVAEVTTQEIF